MKFEAEDPSEVKKSGDAVDRSQGAARAISVRISRVLLLRLVSEIQSSCLYSHLSTLDFTGVTSIGSRRSRRVSGSRSLYQVIHRSL